MRIEISHRTTYRYEQPVRSLLQILRLTPRTDEGQRVVRWRVEPSVDGRLRPGEDGLGNLTLTFEVDRPVELVTLEVRGEVETTDNAGVLTGCVERAPDAFYLRETELTMADDAIRGFSASIGEGDRLDVLHRLLRAVAGSMTFDVAPTHSGTSAAAAFALGRGVCQDLTHVFLAAARLLGIPSRYVSGYFHRNDGVDAQAAGHAWAEAKVDGLGWIGFDPTNGICVTDAHVRVAIGLDYQAAAPVRGSRRGGGLETMEVDLLVQAARRQSQA